MIFFALLALSALASADKCDDIIKDKSKPFTGKTCHNKWSNLKQFMKPTQSDVGYAWVQKKTADYNSEKAAQKTMDDNPIPVVIGPDLYFYVVDQHHELSAFDYSGYTHVKVTLKVTCDQRQLSTSAFWSMMKTSHLVYLGSLSGIFSLPATITPEQLPQTFSFTKTSKSFGNDPWRSLASFGRKVNDPNLVQLHGKCPKKSELCYRDFYRGCGNGTLPSGPGVAFFEFRWGYYFISGVTSPDPTAFWPADQQAAFMDAFDQQVHVEMGSYDLTSWSTIASLLIPLARSVKARDFQVPETIFDTTTLPGYAGDYPNGQIPLDDPDCSPPACPDASSHDEF
jgi:hypothetical protein